MTVFWFLLYAQKERLRGERCLLCLCKRLHGADRRDEIWCKWGRGARVRDCDWPRNSAGRRPLPRLSTESNKNAAGYKQMFAICEGMCYTENETRNLGKRSVCHVLFGAIHGAKRDRELPGDGGGGLPPRAAAV